MEKSTFTFSIELFAFHSSRSGRLKTRFSRKENLEKPTSFEEQNRGIFRKTFILTLLFSAVFHLQNCISDYFS